MHACDSGSATRAEAERPNFPDRRLLCHPAAYLTTFQELSLLSRHTLRAGRFRPSERCGRHDDRYCGAPWVKTTPVMGFRPGGWPMPKAYCPNAWTWRERRLSGKATPIRRSAGPQFRCRCAVCRCAVRASVLRVLRCKSEPAPGSADFDPGPDRRQRGGFGYESAETASSQRERSRLA